MLAALATIDWGIVARAVHIVGVVMWIGGVGFVTTVLLPSMRTKPAAEWAREFDAVERRFAPQARIAIVIVLLSGLYMLDRYDLWTRFAQGEYWWMDLMVGVWLLFVAQLFVVEPFVLRHAVRKHVVSDPEATLTRMLWLHRVMLVLSLTAVFAAVGGGHGLF